MSPAGEISALIDKRIQLLKYILALQGGDVYYMNIVRLENAQLAYLDRHFPLKVNSVVRLGLSFGSLLNYPITSKLNSYLQYLLNMLDEHMLTDDKTLEAAISNLETELANRQREAAISRQKEIAKEYIARYGYPKYTGQNKQLASRIPKEFKSSGDLHTFASLQVDTGLAQESQSPISPFAAKSRHGSPTTPKPLASANSLGRSSAHSLKKSISHNRLTSKLRKMKSTNSLWNSEGSQAQLAAKSNGAQASNGAANSKENNYSSVANSIVGRDNINRQFSEKSFPINLPMDNIYSLTNLLKMLIKLLDKISEHIEKQKQLKLTLIQNKARQAPDVYSNHLDNELRQQHFVTANLAHANAFSYTPPQATSVPPYNANASNSRSTNLACNPSLDAYQPPKLFPSNSSSSSLHTGLFPSLSPDASCSVPYNGPLGSPTTLKTSASVHSSLANSAFPETASLPLSPFSTQSTNAFPGSASSKRLAYSNDKSSIATEITEQSSTYSNTNYNGGNFLSPDSTLNTSAVSNAFVPEKEEILTVDLSSQGIDKETFHLFETIDSKIQVFMFEPILEVVDYISDNLMQQDLTQIMSCLSFEDENDESVCFLDQGRI